MGREAYEYIYLLVAKYRDQPVSFNRAIGRTVLAVIVVVAIIAFATGFLARTPSQILATITVKETSTVASPQIVIQTLARTISITTAITSTSVPTIYRSITAIETVRQTETITAASTIVSTVTRIQGLPEGATPLPFAGKTAFTLIATGLSFNGSSRGSLSIYIPAGWGINVTFINSNAARHSIAVIRNSTATPQSSDIALDGVVIVSQPPQYSVGIPSGSTAQLIVDSVPEGVYWIACGVPGHARAGMWIILVSTPNVSIPYAMALQPSGGGYQYGYGGSDIAVAIFMMLLIITAALMAILGRGFYGLGTNA